MLACHDLPCCPAAMEATSRCVLWLRVRDDDPCLWQRSRLVDFDTLRVCCAVVLSICRVSDLSHAARSLVDRCLRRRLRGSHLLGCDVGRRRKLHACVHVDMQFIRSIGFHHQKKRLSRRDAHAMVGRTGGNSTTAVKRADACNRGDHLFNTRTELIKLAHNRRPERRSVQSPKKGVAPRYSVTLPLVYLHVTASQSWTPSAAVACTQ